MLVFTAHLRTENALPHVAVPDRQQRVNGASALAPPCGADTDLVDRQLEWIAVERISLYAEQLQIRRALFRLRQLWGLPDAAPAPAVTATVHQRRREARVASEAEVLLLLQLLVPMDLAPLAALSPEMRKVRTFALLRHLLRHASQRQPLLLAVENLHWSDPTSEEWLASLVEQLGDMPVLLLVTYRPGYQPPWPRHSAATQMALPRLSPHDSLVVLQSVPQAVQLPASLQQTIVAKAAGNPFFVEELTWAAMAHSNRAGPLPLPDTIETVLAARLDSLPPEAKRLVQIAAVIGPEVPVPLLQTIAGLSKEAASMAWRTSRPRSSCMRRCSSPARSIP